MKYFKKAGFASTIEVVPDNATDDNEKIDPFGFKCPC